MRKAILSRYFKDVLGLHSIVLSRGASKDVQKKIKPLILFILGRDGFVSEDSRHLFQKMVEAMRLSDKEWKISYEYDGSLSEVYVFFCKKEYERACFKKWSMLTYGPNDLLLNPKYKKQTWADLREVMEWVGKL